ncbi:HEAT repeat protein [Salinispora arenicola]|uniref:HEAT repeat protein n=1 Tax=Salinispora arenicola TaxID=168697 RepID=A0A542XM66_SALAC|nr:HEAT repeat protein [Salinispora arenicola]
MAVASLAEAIVSQVSDRVGGAAARGVRALVWGDPERKALERALGRAFAEVGAVHGGVLADFDVNQGFWEREGAAELSKVLVAGLTPSAARLAERAVDSLGRSRSDDERLDRIYRLRPVFTVLADEVRGESALHPVLGRADAARAGVSAAAIAEALGAVPASEDDRVRYLGWVVDQHRYVRTAGVVRNTHVQLPLDEVFVGLRAQRDRHPGDRARGWFEQERQKAVALLEAGQLDETGYEAALDRLQAQYGRRFTADDAGLPEQSVLVLDAVRDGPQVLVLGDPGTGKTTLLRYLALCHARGLLNGGSVLGRPARFPIYVRIGEYARQGYPRVGISDFLPGYLNRSECRAPGLARLLGQQLEAGRCLVLLDGLDEIGSAELRRGVVTAVTNFVAAHSRSGNRFVVTSRIAGYQAAALPEPFTALRLQDMDDDTISRFLQVYCRQVHQAETPANSQAAIIEAGARDATAIGQALRSNAGVRRLAVNPLLLTALVLVHRASGRLPHRRVEAYVEVCTALGRAWRSAQGVAEADLPDERILTRWLTELGAWMHQHRPEGSASRAELLGVLGPWWARHHGIDWDPNVLTAADPLGTDAGRGVLEFVDKADTHTGLLVERAPGRYGFAHLTFEEYYAGRALAFRGTATQRITALRSRLHDPRYTEPILLALGLIGTDYADQIDDVVAEAIYPGTEPSLHEDLLGRDFLFMLRVLADDTPVLTATIDAVVTTAITELLDPERSRCRFTGYRRALEQHLAALAGTKAAERYILAVDKHADLLTPDTMRPWIVLAGIAARLGTLPTTTATTLVHLATHATNPDVQVQAGSALTAGGGALTEPVITALVHLATHATNPSVQVQAGSALAAGGALTEPVITALVRLATHATNPDVRVQAVWALARGRALTEPVITVLVRLATHATNPDVRVQAVWALARGRALTEPVITVLVRLATHATNPDVRVQAVWTLADGGALTEPVITVLVRLATDATDPFVQVLAGVGLADGGVLTEPVITVLVRLATHATNPSVRVEAGVALARGRALTEPVITALVHLATHATNPAVQAQAGLALAAGGALTEPVITALVHLATHATNPDVRVQAVWTLADGGALTEPVITVLVRLATHATNPSVQAQAGLALARGGVLTEPVITVLVRLATHATNPSVQAQAGSALAGGGVLTEPVITVLVRLATDATNPAVRVQAVWALARGGALTEPVVTTLLQLAANNENTFARQETVEALQEAPPTPSLRKSLIELFRDDNHGVRRAAAATLVELSRRHPEHANEIRSDLASACTNPALGIRDKHEARTGWDYAHEGLSAHVEALTHTTITE